jgi:lipoprotein-anchoring transpeptidase ErfK/SrfK
MRGRIVAIALTAAVVAVGGWWTFYRDTGVPDEDRLTVTQAPSGNSENTGVRDAVALGSEIELAADVRAEPTKPEPEPEAITASPAEDDLASAEEAEGLAPDPDRDRLRRLKERIAGHGERDADPETPDRTGHVEIEAARQAYAAGKVLEAREKLSRLLRQDLSLEEADEARALLARIADETIFSGRNAKEDPLIEEYVVQAGDALISIGKKYHVPPGVVMKMNRIRNPRSIRAGQHLKVPRGPFHARIIKSQFRIDVYLADTFVDSFPVGLGSENGTPEGTWKVKNRLVRPTYYPPASASDKRIIPAGHPDNPLGSHWIGLEGTGGDAVGREGYGIHGTKEPESIGKSVSLGCIRMHNEDVAQVFSLLMPGQSTVTIMP